jgi:predicted GNAT family N-acyltransferase
VSEAARFRFERLSAAHDRAGFSCEHASLTDYLLKFAGQNERGDLAACYVALPAGSDKVAGYYTLSAHAVLCDELSEEQRKGLPRYDRIPAFLIGRLARDLSMKGQGLGELLLIDAIARLASAEAAGRMIVVDPNDTKASDFYSRYGFRPLGQATARLYLPMWVARKALGET